MKEARCILDKDYVIGEPNHWLAGSFVEHLGRVTYGGIYEPTHPMADEYGFRRDVIEAVKELGISMVRYPGGNFVSGYKWTDGIGPKDKRPKKLDLAWKNIEPNEVGIDEFVEWKNKVGTETMIVVNLGTGTPQEAADLVEYCNYPSGTYWSDLRRQYGHEQPYNIKLWGLGNEMDGPWQICALSAEDYGKKARETAKMMKWVDSSIELVVCGSSAPEVPTYPDWDRIVLEYTYEYIDYISIHRYYSYNPQHHLFYPSFDEPSDVPFFPIDLQNYIRTVSSTIDFAKAKRRSGKNVYISFDEWGVVSENPGSSDVGDISNLLDALIYGGILCVFLKYCNKVKIACQSLLVNAGGMIYTVKGGPLVKNTTFYPFCDVARECQTQGSVVLDQTSSPTLETKHYGEVPAIQSASIYNKEEKKITTFLINFDPKEDIKFIIDLRSFGKVTPIEHFVLTDTDMFAKNTPEEPDKVVPRRVSTSEVKNDIVEVILPKLSWNVLKFKLD